jgi:reverse gyrase
MSAFEPMECQNHANCGDYCETEREREMVLCEDCLDSFDQRQADLAELKTIRTANQRLEGEVKALREALEQIEKDDWQSSQTATDFAISQTKGMLISRMKQTARAALRGNGG